MEIHTTFLGGGFGRRANPRSDFVTEAVQVAMEVLLVMEQMVVMVRQVREVAEAVVVRLELVEQVATAALDL